MLRALGGVCKVLSQVISDGSGACEAGAAGASAFEDGEVSVGVGLGFGQGDLGRKECQQL